MAIKIVKEVQNKESAKDNITSAKGTYPALIILPKTDLDVVNELRLSENKALCSDPTSAGSYYVWFWCPSVDGKYETDNRQYNRVNVPKYNEEGTELTYVVGDVIDISFDDGDISAPRFIRLWGLINNDEGKESVTSNVVGIKTGNFPSILPDALDMASNQAGTAAYNLYPDLYKILTGGKTESPTDFSDYSSYNTDSVWFQDLVTLETTIEVINSRFKQGILPFSSKWSSAYPFKESELDDFNPFDHHRSSPLYFTPLNPNASPTRHLNPYWNFDDDRQDISYIKNFIMFFKTIAEKSGKEKSKTEAMEILQVLKSEIESSTTNDKDRDINKEEMFEELVDQFSRGVNPTFAGPKERENWWNPFKSKSTNSIETKKVLDSYSKHGQIMRSATMTYLIAILNLAVSYFQGAEIHNYFDVLVYVSLYPYVRHFYGATITLDDNLSIKGIENKDFQTMSVGLLSNKKVFNKIRKWAIKYVTVAQKKKKEKVGFFGQIKELFSTEEADKIANDAMNILKEVREYYFKLSNIEDKQALLISWLNIFIEDDEEKDEKIKKAKDRLNFIVEMINEEDDNFLNKVNDITNGTEGKVQSTGTFKWPVPSAKIENITSGFSGSEIYNPDPDRTDHNGIDIAMPEGTPIVAADNGIVTRADNNVRGFKEGSYGNIVKIDHENSFTTLYGHMVEGSVLVKVSQRVSKGEKIGEVGNTGQSTGNHLHFTIFQGSTAVDPMKYFYGTLDEESQDEVSLVPDPYPKRVFNSFESLVALGFSTPIYKFIKDLAEIDSNGLVKIGDYYCVAMGSFYRNSKNKNTWGSLYEITTEHGQRYKVVTTDTKSDTETDPKHQYHLHGDNSIIEFLVNENYKSKQAWEGPIYNRKADIINTQFPWKGKITSIKEIGVHPNAKNYRW